MYSLIVVRYINEKIADETFHNAEVAVAEPGIFVVQSATGERLAMFPMGVVAGILYPEGKSRITEVTL